MPLFVPTTQILRALPASMITGQKESGRVTVLRGIVRCRCCRGCSCSCGCYLAIRSRFASELRCYCEPSPAVIAARLAADSVDTFLGYESAPSPHKLLDRCRWWKALSVQAAVVVRCLVDRLDSGHAQHRQTAGVFGEFFPAEDRFWIRAALHSIGF